MEVNRSFQMILEMLIHTLWERNIRDNPHFYALDLLHVHPGMPSRARGGCSEKVYQLSVLDLRRDVSDRHRYAGSCDTLAAVSIRLYSIEHVYSR